MTATDCLKVQIAHTLAKLNNPPMLVDASLRPSGRKQASLVPGGLTFVKDLGDGKPIFDIGMMDHLERQVKCLQRITAPQRRNKRCRWSAN
jgi:hypothetical protein